MSLSDKLDSVAEWSVAKIATRYLVPLLLAVSAWMLPRYLDTLTEGILKEIEEVQQHVELVDKTASAKIEQVKREQDGLQEHTVEVQTELTKTLTEVQRTLAVQQSTSQAQYERLKDDVEEVKDRQDRLEDRFIGPMRER